MGSLFNLINLIHGLLPLLIQIITTVERSMPEGTPGAAKLEAVKGTLESAWTVADGVEHTFAQAWPMLSGAVGGIVSAMNLAGHFTHAAPAEQPAAPVVNADIAGQVSG